MRAPRTPSRYHRGYHGSGSHEPGVSVARSARPARSLSRVSGRETEVGMNSAMTAAEGLRSTPCFFLGKRASNRRLPWVTPVWLVCEGHLLEGPPLQLGDSCCLRAVRGTGAQGGRRRSSVGVQREPEGSLRPLRPWSPLRRGARELSRPCHLQIAFSLPSRSRAALCFCARWANSTWRPSAASTTRSAASSKLPLPVGSYSTYDVSPSLILRVCGRSLERMSERVPERSSWWW
jgi:hypothetical protein